MFFNAFFGNRENLSEWRELLYWHVKWLDLVSHIEVRKLENNKIFAFAWLRSKNSNYNPYFLETEDYIVLNTCCNYQYKEKYYRTPWQYINENVDKNTVHLGICLKTGEIRVLMPLTTPEKLYYSQDSRGYIFSNDMRMLLRWTGFEIDDRAIYGLFKFRSIPSPFALSKNVQAIPEGFVLKVTPESFYPKIEVSEEIKKYIFSDRNDGLMDPDKKLEEVLDNNLKCVPDSSVVFFSGGVDSVSIALRLAKMGRTDISLVNFISDWKDLANSSAEQLAKHIGLPFEQIKFNYEDISEVLDNFYRDYSCIVCDPAVLPANLMVKAASRLMGNFNCAIDGTGADSSFVANFPLYYKYKKIYKLPLSIRRFGSELYKKFELWRHDSSIFKPVRAVRRSELTSIVDLEFCNIFENVAYYIPQDIHRLYEDTSIKNIYQTYSGYEDKYSDFVYMSIINLIDSSNNSARKTFDPLRNNGARLLCPYLEPSLLRLSFSIPWDCKISKEPKLLIKELAAKNLENSFTFPKEPFKPSYNILADLKVREFINDVVLARDNPIIEFFNVEVVRNMIKQTDRDHIDPDLFGFLWSLIFVSGWIKQMKSVHASQFSAPVYENLRMKS